MRNAKTPLPPLAPIDASSNLLDRLLSIGPAPLLPGENEADYSDLSARIVGAARPRDFIEEIFVRDIVDLTWEVMRIRRVKIGMLKASMSHGVQSLLASLGHPSQGPMSSFGPRLHELWAAGHTEARKVVDTVIKKAGLTIADVTGVATTGARP